MFSRQTRKKSSKGKNYSSQISNDSFKQLAKSNVRKSIKDYMIYFITLSFGAALLYSFSSIGDTLSYFMSNNLLQAYIYMSKGILDIFSIVICLIFGFLITYSNNFIMKKRKREFGIYITLGMDKRDINKLMFKETTIIGALSLVFGLIFGIFASQGISIIAFNMLDLDSSMLGFSISIVSVIKTILLFVFVLFLVNKFNKRNIEKYKLIDLINSSKKNETTIASNSIKNFIVFILSIVIMGGCYLLLNSLIEPNPKIIGLCIILISFATYLFFVSVSDFVFSQIKKCKGVYYKNLNMLIISQMSSRIKTMSLSITAICLIIFSSLIIIPFGMGFSNYFKQDVGKLAPFDASITRYNYDIFHNGNHKELYSNSSPLKNKDYVSLKNQLIENTSSYDELVSKSSEIKTYNLSNITYNKLFNTNEDDYNLSIISITDYNKTREQQGLDKINIKNNEFAINGDISQLKSNHSNLELSINSNTLRYSGLNPNIYYYNSNVPHNPIAIIVPDNILNNLYPLLSYLNVNYIESSNDYDNRFLSEFYKLNDNTDSELRFESRLVVDGENISLSLIFSFISVYLGIILLISAGAILSLQHISEAMASKDRFNILRNLGVKEKDIKRAIFTQVLIFFMIPLLLAFMHYLFISNMLYNIVVELSNSGIYKNILVSFIIIIVIYSSYFFASYYESLNIIMDKKDN